jgi:tRNA threonylcarbamoyladenosine biosynthesis protein TsaB
MRVLGIETSTISGSVAILDNDRVLGELSLNVGPVHSEKLLPIIDWLLNEADIDKKGIEAVSVSIGPGSFTALRIGISTAKALAFSLKIPIVGVSSLEVLAANLIFTPFTICSIIDARKKEVFVGFFRSYDGRLERVSDDMLIAPKTIPDIIEEKTIFVGDGSTLYQDFINAALGELALFCPSPLNMPRAACCALLGVQRLKKGYKDDLLNLVPRYLRRADAEIYRER